MEFLLLFPLIVLILATPVLALIAVIFSAQNRVRIRTLEQENAVLKKRLQAAAPAVPAPTPPPENKPKPIPVPVPQPAPAPQPAPVPVSRKTEAPEPKRELESVLGKNVLALVATGLIFVGLIAFGVLAFTQITAGAKIALLFLSSLLITGAGFFLTFKKRTTFAQILTGCGVGALYISILVSHLYFGVFNDLVAFGLILLWGAAVLFVSNKWNLRILFYIAHLGCILSTVLSVGYGEASGRYWEIVLYQIVTFALLLGFNRKTPWLHALCSLLSAVLNPVLCFLLADEAGSEIYGSATGAVLFCLCLVLNLFTVALYRMNLNRTNLASVVAVNAVALLSLFFGGYGALSACLDPYLSADAMEWALAGLGFVLPLLLVAAALPLRRINRLNRAATVLSAILFSALLSVAIAGENSDPEPTLWVIHALACALCGLIWKKKHNCDSAATVYHWVGTGILLLDAFICIWTAPDLPHGGIVYTLALVAAALVILRLRYSSVLAFPLLPAAILCLPVTVSAMEASSQWFGTEWWGVVAPCAGLILLQGIRNLRIKDPSAAQAISDSCWEALSALWIIVFSVAIIEAGDAQFPDKSLLPCLITSALLLILGLMNLPRVLNSRSTPLTVWYAVKFTALTLLPIAQFTTLFDEQFLLSLALMLAAVICILAGFLAKLKGVRVYGLVLLLSAVLKMVILDVWDRDSLIRVVSLLAGGVICFAVSALYNVAEERQKRNALKRSE